METTDSHDGIGDKEGCGDIEMRWAQADACAGWGRVIVSTKRAKAQADACAIGGKKLSRISTHKILNPPGRLKILSHSITVLCAIQF